MHHTRDHDRHRRPRDPLLAIAYARERCLWAWTLIVSVAGWTTVVAAAILVLELAR